MKLKLPENIAIYLVTIAFFFPIFVAHALVLFTPDSGAYLLNSFELFVPADRPIFYSLYIHLAQIIWNNPVFNTILQWTTFHGQAKTTFNSSLFAQVILPTSILILAELFLFIRNFFPTQNSTTKSLQLLSIFLLTPVSWIAIQLMPDIFGPIMVLATANFLIANNKWHQLLHASIILIAASTHNSHILILSLFAVTAQLLQKYFYQSIDKQSLKQLFVLSFIPWAMIICTNLYVGNGFTTSKSNHVFIMGKWCENGMLNRFINNEKNTIISKDTAVQHQFQKLCSVQSALPAHAWDFVWNNQPQSPFQISGGWHQSKKLYHTIFTHCLTHPQYWPYLFSSTVLETGKQILLTGVGDGITPIDSNAAVGTTLKIHYPKDYQALFTKNKQQTWGINFGAWNQWYLTIAIILNAAFLYILYNKKLFSQFNPRQRVAVLSILFFVIYNALVTANFANVLARLNARFIWLWHALIILMIFQLIANYLQNKNQSIR